MPCDNQSQTSGNEAFVDTLNYTEQLIRGEKHNAVIICGDFNTSFQRHNFKLQL